MYIILLCVSALIFSVQFMFNDGYQKENGVGWSSSVKLSFFYCLSVFVLNGMVGAISKLHQCFEDLAVDNASFLILTKAVVIFACIFPMIKSKDMKIAFAAIKGV